MANPLRCKSCDFVGKNKKSLGAHVGVKHGGGIAQPAKVDEQDVGTYLVTAMMRLTVRRDELSSQIGGLQEIQGVLIAELERVRKAREVYEADHPVLVA